MPLYLRQMNRLNISMARKTAIPSLPRPIANIPLMPLNLDFWQNAIVWVSADRIPELIFLK